MPAATNHLASIRAAFPAEGLFAEKDFLLSPEPFPIDEKFAKELEQLGHRLYVFQRGCNELYQRSIKGKQPAWIAQYLDAGKPPELVEFSRQKQFRDDVPLVIRPDLILTEAGYTIAEIDSVPGGIGLTGWLNQTYAGLGRDVIGGSDSRHNGTRPSAWSVSNAFGCGGCTSPAPRSVSTAAPPLCISSSLSSRTNKAMRGCR